MNQPLRTIFALPKGMLLFLAIYAASFPVIYLEVKLTGRSMVVDWLGLAPALAWKGQLWRLMTYALVAGGALAWAVNTFWFATFMTILRNDWSSLNFWIYCLVAAVAGALPILFIFPHADVHFVGAWGPVLALVVAWDRFYRHERVVLLGLGEVSVRQAAVFIGVLNLVICFFGCGGWLITLSMLCGGAAGWVWLAIGHKSVMSRGSRVVESERAARLEL